MYGKRWVWLMRNSFSQKTIIDAIIASRLMEDYVVLNANFDQHHQQGQGTSSSSSQHVHSSAHLHNAHGGGAQHSHHSSTHASGSSGGAILESVTFVSLMKINLGSID
jgi:hypothetical protein